MFSVSPRKTDTHDVKSQCGNVHRIPKSRKWKQSVHTCSHPFVFVMNVFPMCISRSSLVNMKPSCCDDLQTTLTHSQERNKQDPMTVKSMELIVRLFIVSCGRRSVTRPSPESSSCTPSCSHCTSSLEALEHTEGSRPSVI